MSIMTFSAHMKNVRNTYTQLVFFFPSSKVTNGRCQTCKTRCWTIVLLLTTGWTNKWNNLRKNIIAVIKVLLGRYIWYIVPLALEHTGSWNFRTRVGKHENRSANPWSYLLSSWTIQRSKARFSYPDDCSRILEILGIFFVPSCSHRSMLCLIKVLVGG